MKPDRDVSTSTPRNGKGFFAVGTDTFHKAVDLGLNPACVFLTMARGTGPDDVTTSWSAQAAATRLGVRWTAAKSAVQELKRAKLLSVTRESTKPQYTLVKKGDAIILPNSLIDGASGELPPLRRVRQMQDPLTLRLLIDLYAATDLPAWGGIDPSIVRAEYDIERVGERGAFVAWRFEFQTSMTTWNAVTQCHRLVGDNIPDGGNAASAFWERLFALVGDGLIQLVPTVCEGEHGEALFPMAVGTDVEPETDLYAVAASAGLIVAPTWADDGSVLVPLPRRIVRPAVRGIYRLRYRAQTAPTRAWYADHARTCRTYLRDFGRVVDGDTSHTLRFGVASVGAEQDAA